MMSCVVLPPKTAILFKRKSVLPSRSCRLIFLDFFRIYSLSKGYANSFMISSVPEHFKLRHINACQYIITHPRHCLQTITALY